MSKPGTHVRIGRQMPRYSAGASGFMSYMSMWPGPPSSQIRMTEVLREVGFVPKLELGNEARALRICGNPRAAIPETPSFKKLRRLSPSQYRPAAPRSRLNMTPPLKQKTYLSHRQTRAEFSMQVAFILALGRREGNG